jgi:hypothetical protein
MWFWPSSNKIKVIESSNKIKVIESSNKIKGIGPGKRRINAQSP